MAMKKIKVQENQLEWANFEKHNEIIEAIQWQANCDGEFIIMEKINDA